MTCYFRHLDPVFRRAGLQIDIDNRKRVDMIIHEMVGVQYKDCCQTWAAVKEMLQNEDAFVERLRAECQTHNIYLDY
ncbi:MAG: hypothetical protein AB9819_05765 [Methanomassiliicoccales archaeon]